MAKTRRKRSIYTPAQRAQILATAAREKLTALGVKKKFGVTPVTYYSWRKKSGASGRRGRTVVGRSAVGFLGQDLPSQVRNEVRTKIRELLPAIVRAEVATYMGALFVSSRRGRRRRV